MTRLSLAAIAVAAAALSPHAAVAAGNARSDVERNGLIQQSIYDFHRQNAERRPAFVAPRPAPAPRARR
jgi:hypothetical protein